MGRRGMGVFGRLGLVALVTIGLGGCLVEDLPPLTVAESRPHNLIERTLAACADKTVEAETACVRAGVASSGVGTAELAALIPGCRFGSACTYEYTTEDRVGYLSVYATHLRYGFHLVFDFSKRPKTVGDVPITVAVR